MMPYTSAARPATDSSVPIGSSRGGRDSRVAGTIAIVPASASAAITTLSAKIDGQRQPLEQQAGREQAEHAAAGGDADPGADGLAALLGREDRGDHRQRDRHHERRADAHQRRAGRSARRASARTARRSDASPYSASPTASTGLRPMRSPIAPAGSSSAANVSAYASTIHWSCVCVAPVSRAIRERDVEAGDCRHDHHQRQAHDPEHRSPPSRFALECGLRFMTSPLLEIHRLLISTSVELDCDDVKAPERPGDAPAPRRPASRSRPPPARVRGARLRPRDVPRHRHGGRGRPRARRALLRVEGGALPAR